MQLSQAKIASERGSGEVEVGTLKNQKDKQNSHASKEKGSNIKGSSSAENVRKVNAKSDNVTVQTFIVATTQLANKGCQLA